MTIAELNKIERKTLIRAPRSRVWRAVTNPKEFSKWFSADFEGTFVEGHRIEMTSTHPSCKNKPFYIIVERMEPERLFSWRWHPGSADKEADGTTLVEFHLEEAKEGTLVTVIETGFDRISLARRAKAFGENDKGWEIQMKALEQYVLTSA